MVAKTVGSEIIYLERRRRRNQFGKYTNLILDFKMLMDNVGHKIENKCTQNSEKLN